MPCESGPYGNESEEQERELTAATRAACEMAQYINSWDRVYYLSQATQRWIRKHQKLDDERRLREAEERQEKADRKKALAKLSKKERALLHL